MTDCFQLLRKDIMEKCMNLRQANLSIKARDFNALEGMVLILLEIS